ncbi:DNA dC-_dU-editing enzyme APOBEC-3F-like [Saccopteryx leptura]|uniref:DNA dC->dU-editing enzyme APOBEC-3F-like n=1 Tax=Saccopteryx leptura TaxID=249018 RepID=UPI00339C4721
MARRKPWYSNPKKKFPHGYFYFHFTNLPTPKYRNGCYICFQVERTQPGPPMICYRGVFENQFYPKQPLHVELCFLKWYRDTILPLGGRYRVTWYISWSPCFQCAETVADFLGKHTNMSLRIVAARLYYSKKPECQQGLLSLCAAGATLAIMSPDEFKHCWETFVDHQGQPFQPQFNIDQNYQILTQRLKSILNTQRQNPMERLSPRTFTFHFRNLLDAPGRNATYLCVRVEKWKRGSFRPFYKWIFRNQFYPETLHAELCFLDWFRSIILLLGGRYQVSWYISWSPCSHCAAQVADFLRDHENVSLSIFAARLYLWDDEDEQGLQDLAEAGAQVAMMCPCDFEYCWDHFVDNQGMDFRYWKNVRRHYYFLQDKLNRILW